MKIEITEKINNRIDIYLSKILGESRNNITKNISSGNILVNDKIVKSGYKPKIGDIILVKLKNDTPNIIPENIKLDIYYEDDDIIVVNKPSGMVVHPAVGNYSHTLVNALMYHCNNLSQVNGVIRPGIIHRIDADTSGLLLVAKNDMAHVDLAKQISEKSVKREYIALVDGVIKEDTATIDAPIGRDVKNRKKMCVTADNSKDAITNIKVIERYKNSTLITCSLLTGRTHQIRVHMNYIGHSVINDPVYGSKKLVDSLFGQMLHARKIGFVHPRTHEYMEFTCEPPEKFLDILEMYKDK